MRRPMIRKRQRRNPRSVFRLGTREGTQYLRDNLDDTLDSPQGLANPIENGRVAQSLKTIHEHADNCGLRWVVARTSSTPKRH